MLTAVIGLFISFDFKRAFLFVLDSDAFGVSAGFSTFLIHEVRVLTFYLFFYFPYSFYSLSS